MGNVANGNLSILGGVADVLRVRPGDVRELRPYDPHHADKDVEIGDFYFKRDNYKAAESRYAEALEYMPNHAAATYKLAEAQELLAELALEDNNNAKAIDEAKKALEIDSNAEQAKAVGVGPP